MSRWHEQHLKILKDFGEVSASYRWLHYYTHIRYKIKNYAYMIPVIILSTLTGTANFAQSQVPGSFATYVPLVIGFINILCGILTTIYQFTKIAEMMEAHRISSISYGKLSRNIDIMINLPEEYRKLSGDEFLKECKTELDKLIDSSQTIPKDLLKKYSVMADTNGVKQPEISTVNRKTIYQVIDSFIPKKRIKKYYFWNKNKPNIIPQIVINDVEKNILNIPEIPENIPENPEESLETTPLN
jgi:hypothetical protein